MSREIETGAKVADGARSVPATFYYYGWVNVAVAALLVNATLPARTHGLGLITKPLLEDLALDEIAYGWINGFSLLLGVALCVPIGRCLDRFGSRLVLTLVALAFGLVTLWMAFIVEPISLFVALTLSRGLGQAGITAGASALVGKWFRRHLGSAMAAYSILMGAGFVVATGVAGQSVIQFGWRATWIWLGLGILTIVTPLSGVFLRSKPASDVPELETAPPPDPNRSPSSEAPPTDSHTLWQAVRTPAFWIFTLSYSMFALSWSAITLFNELILAERGFGKETFLLTMVILPIGGGLAQVFVGWLANHWRLGGVMALGMFFLAVSLLAFPFLQFTWQIVLYALGLGFAGSFIMVSYLAFYPKAFGRGHLGQIHGVAQLVSVLMSAAGPLLLEYCQRHSGSYATMFFGASSVMLVLSAAAWFVPMPRRATSV